MNSAIRQVRRRREKKFYTDEDFRACITLLQNRGDGLLRQLILGYEAFRKSKYLSCSGEINGTGHSAAYSRGF